MPKRKKAHHSKSAAKKPPAPLTPAQEANQITWRLKGELKNARIACLRIGGLLARLRDQKLYAALGFPDIERYAEARLQLGKTSLYRYILAYDWTRRNHPEWLQPKPKGFIIDLSDIVDMIWIEQELGKKDLQPKRRAELEALQKKAEEGALRKGEITPLRRHANSGSDGLKSFLSKLLLLRRRGAQQAQMPPEVITHLDAAIGILKNDSSLKVAGIHFLDALDADVSAVALA